MTDPFVVRDTDGLSAARLAFLQAVEAGECHLEIELPAGCLGIDSVGELRLGGCRLAVGEARVLGA